MRSHLLDMANRKNSEIDFNISIQTRDYIVIQAK